jgi:hypothetical protein
VRKIGTAWGDKQKEHLVQLDTEVEEARARNDLPAARAQIAKARFPPQGTRTFLRVGSREIAAPDRSDLPESERDEFEGSRRTSTRR